MTKFTLSEICQSLLLRGLYDFSSPLQVCYRLVEPDGKDGLFGYCVVQKTASDFEELFINDPERSLYHDGDSYGLDTRELFMWEFHPEQGTTSPCLCVWMETDWSYESQEEEEEPQNV